MPSTDIITRLRPASGRATDIAASITLAEVAAAEQQAAVARAKAARDDGLLDADPATLRRAEAALAEVREQAERVAAVLANLQQRHAAAVEAETVGGVDDLRSKAEETDEELSRWWKTTRVMLVEELTKGVALHNAAFNARHSFDRAVDAAKQAYPERTYSPPIPPTVDGTSWTSDVSRAVGLLDVLPDALEGLLRAGDPRPPGTWPA